MIVFFMLKRYFILLVCLIALQPSYLRAIVSVDSLRNVYYSTNDFTVRKKLLIEICDNHKALPIDSLSKYIGVLSDIADQSKKEEDILTCNYYTALRCLKVGKLDSFKYYYQSSQKNLENYYPLFIRFTYSYGSYFVKMNEHQNAFTQFYKTLKLADEHKDTMYIVNSKLGIGWTYMEMQQGDKAIEWFKQTLNTTTNPDYQVSYPSAYNNLASCYGGKGEFDTANYYCQKAIELSKQNHDLFTQANASFILGNLFMISDQYKEAERVFMEGFHIHQLIGDPFFIVSDMAQIAIHYANTKQFDKGIAMAKQSIEYANSHGLDAKLLMCYDALAFNYKGSEQFKLYAETLAKMNDLKDSVYTKTSERAVAEMNTKYETEKKEAIIQKQEFAIKQRNYLLFGGLAFIILAMSIGILLYRNHNHKQEKYLQQELMRQQDLASEAILEAEENERRRIAADLHDGVGQMLSAVKLNLEGLTDRISITNSEDKLVYEKVKMMMDESCKEVRNVSHNIMPNALIKSGLGNAVKDFIDKVNSDRLKINLDINGINEKLSSNVEIVVYRVIQECVNNVIKHADANKLDISIVKDIDGLNVTIEDNGKGFNVSNLENSKGIGMKNIRTRIEYLKGTLDIDTKPGKGTLIAFYIPA